MIKETFEFKNKTYPVIELENFETADGYYIDYADFTSEDFIDADNNTFLYRIIDDRMYGYLPRELIEKGTESEIRKYIYNYIG